MDIASRRTTWQAAGLMLAGALVGGVLAAEVTANAASPGANSSGTRPAAQSAYGEGPMAAGPGGPGRFAGPGHRGFGLDQSGTVTAVGTDLVTIKTANGTKTYSVDSHSDIDKNGEAHLSDLKAGDAVHFVVRPGTSTIAVLHAGNEALNRPAMGSGRHGGGGPCPNMGGARPTPSPSSST